MLDLSIPDELFRRNEGQFCNVRRPGESGHAAIPVEMLEFRIQRETAEHKDWHSMFPVHTYSPPVGILRVGAEQSFPYREGEEILFIRWWMTWEGLRAVKGLFVFGEPEPLRLRQLTAPVTEPLFEANLIYKGPAG